MNYDNLITKIFYNTPSGKVNHILFRKVFSYPNISKYLITRYKDGKENTIKEIVFRIRHNIEVYPKCLTCGKKLDLTYKNYKPYREYCSFKCAGLSNKSQYKRKQTCLEKYGVEYFLSSKECKDKRKQTCLEKYGVEYVFQSKEIKEKIKQTCLEKYGVINGGGSKEALEKIRNTCMWHFGVPTPFQSDEVKEKIKQTCLEKYGVKNPYMIEYVKKNAHSEESKKKEIETKKKNHTFNTSRPEEELYLYIKGKFPDVRRQYRDNRYPFNCDYYIPTLDYFIELNLHWTHGNHPYDDNSVEDKKKIEEWKLKQTKFYDNAINCWTIRDVKKRKIAKTNNLNYKEIWSLNEGKKFINSLNNI